MTAPGRREYGPDSLARSLAVNEVAERVLDVSALPGDVVLYDPGLARTAFCRSLISARDRASGELTYRDYSIADVVGKHSYLDVARLLIFGELPRDLEEADAWAQMVESFGGDVHTAEVAAVMEAMSDSAEAHALLIAGLAALDSRRHGTVGSHPLERQAVQLFWAFRELVTQASRTVYRCRRAGCTCSEDSATSWAGRLLHVDAADREWAEPLLDSLLTVMADHEIGCSTAVLRACESARVGIFTCAAAAMAAFTGPRHGGAARAFGELLGELAGPEDVPPLLNHVHEGERRLPGFGHRVGSGDQDWRIRWMRNAVETLPDHVRVRPPLVLAQAIEEAVISDSYFAQRRLAANPDFFIAQLLLSIGIPPTLMTVVFALARSAGWTAHWLESRLDPTTKLVRPRQIGSGAALR